MLGKEKGGDETKGDAEAENLEGHFTGSFDTEIANNPGVISDSLLQEKSSHKPSFLEFISKLAPGKSLRTALDDILHARSGALIVIDCVQLINIYEGGFKVDCKFTPQKLCELAKMDGAIVLSSDLKQILYANTLLVPDTRIPTDETGTRHKAAERTSIQVGTPVIAVSERRGKITLFYENQKYVLQNSENLLRRATENLHILEKQREICNDLIINLNILEITGLVSVGDVCAILQRMEIITRIMNMLKRYLIELGEEGTIIQMRVRELVKGIDELELIILKDYLKNPEAAKKILSSMDFDGLLDISILSRILFEISHDAQSHPRGYRLLAKLNLTEREIDSMISQFANFGNMLNADIESIRVVLRQRTDVFRRELENLKEHIMVGKKI